MDWILCCPWVPVGILLVTIVKESVVRNRSESRSEDECCLTGSEDSSQAVAYEASQRLKNEAH